MRRRQSSQLHMPLRTGSPSTSTTQSPQEHLDTRILAFPRQLNGRHGQLSEPERRTASTALLPLGCEATLLESCRYSQASYYNNCTHGGRMTDTRYNVVISREGQPAHQMAEMSATVSGTILLGIMRALIDGGVQDGFSDWAGPGAFGTLKSLIITRIDEAE